MKRTPAIYASVPASEYNASFYYRLILPLWTMQRMGLNVTVDIDYMQSSLHPHERQQHQLTSDINICYQVANPAMVDMMRTLASWPYQTNELGDILAPPSFITDTDDDLFNVSPTNQAFESLGFKDFKGNLLEDGQKIWIRDPRNNELKLLWSDGVNVNYAHNRRRMDSFRETLKLSELITTSGKNTAKYIAREVGPDHEHKIYVYPNCIELAEYTKIELAEHPNEVRILWQGSPTHWEDMMLIKDGLANIMKKHKNVTFIMWGADYPWLVKNLPADRVQLLGWADYRAYKARLNQINHDIALAPLRPTEFNQSRSGIKFYESAACWNPAATVASRTAAYADDIEDGVTGMLFETQSEFETKLEALIEDSKLRKGMAQNAKDWIRTNRDPVIHVPKLYEKYMEVREARLALPSPKKVKNVSKTDKHDIRRSKGKSGKSKRVGRQYNGAPARG